MQTLFKLSFLAVALSASLALADEHQHDDPQYMPKGGYLSTTKAQYVEPSITTTLKVGEKINNITQRNLTGETIIQRLTERTYWAQVGFYNVVFYVGNQGVLLLDSLSDGSGEAIIKAVAKVTDKPITALVYSHAHADHIGDAALLLEAAQKAGNKLRIIASDATANKLIYLNSTLPKPTELVAFDGGTFTFEDLTIQCQGFVRAAHTDDSSAWLLQQEKVLHAPDMTNPDQIPYLNFGGSENSTYLVQNLAQLAQGDWQFFSGGHGNIGSHADLDFMQRYLSDLKIAATHALTKVSASDYFTNTINNHAGAAHSLFEALTKETVNQLRPKYGMYYGFEVSAPYQAESILDVLTSYK